MPLLLFTVPDFPDYILSGLNTDILMRMGCAAVAGILIGVERERRGRVAGLRTTLLVCLAACIAIVISDGFYRKSVELTGAAQGPHPDPARLAAGVLAGMGFLGAGSSSTTGTRLCAERQQRRPCGSQRCWDCLSARVGTDWVRSALSVPF